MHGRSAFQGVFVLAAYPPEACSDKPLTGEKILRLRWMSPQTRSNDANVRVAKQGLPVD